MFNKHNHFESDILRKKTQVVINTEVAADKPLNGFQLEFRLTWDLYALHLSTGPWLIFLLVSLIKSSHVMRQYLKTQTDQ